MSEQLKQQLTKWAKKNGMQLNNKESKKKLKSEMLSQADIEELMGIYRPIYKRGKGGAYKQK
jgi:hypothetical protein